MASAAKIALKELPREMQQHTYAILYQVEETHWWYRGRRRILSLFIEQVCREVKDRRPQILDVGCGTGANLIMLGEYGDAHGIDVSHDALAFCHARGLERVQHGAAEKLPYEDGTFDLVTALDVVEHLDDDMAGLREMRRVLRPDGRALLFVPAFMFLWGVQDDVSHHRRRYTMPQLLKAVREAGFEIERATYANITFFLPILAVRTFMRLLGIKTSTENNIGVSSLNGILGRILGSEATWLRRMNLPFGVSALCVARRVD
jgi:SAM-dependent methyltransferase